MFGEHIGAQEKRFKNIEEKKVELNKLYDKDGIIANENIRQLTELLEGITEQSNDIIGESNMLIEYRLKPFTLVDKEPFKERFEKILTKDEDGFLNIKVDGYIINDLINTAITKYPDSGEEQLANF